MSLQAIYHYNIATTFLVGGEATFAHIAEKCGLSESNVRRIVRHAISNRVFRETRKGVVVHGHVETTCRGRVVLGLRRHRKR